MVSKNKLRYDCWQICPPHFFSSFVLTFGDLFGGFWSFEEEQNFKTNLR